MKNILKTLTVFTLFLVIGAAFATPHKAHALLLDPLFENAPYGPHCLFMDCNNNNNNPQPTNVDNSINNSYNNNTNSFNGGNVSGTPTYNYGNNGGYTEALHVSCYSTPTQANIGQTVQWRSSITGGTGNYYVTWTGTDGLSGIGQYITRSYSSSGTKNASVTVTSSGQTASANCSNSVYIYNDNYNYDYTPNYNYNYYPNYNYNYYPLSVTCRANQTTAQPGSYVWWTAYPSGGNGNYSYSWSGTDGISGYGSSINAYYYNPGTKSAWVTIYSNGQTASAQCSNTVYVGQQYYNTYYPPISYNNNGGLQVACAANKTSASIGSTVTWTAEATLDGYPSGAISYSWTGTNGLYGNQATVYKSYESSGTKSASVTVTANGQTQSASCTNTVYVKSNAVVSKPAPKPTPSPTPAPEISAASILSLNNVPWGWVAVLIILVLLGIILYLIFNKKKI